MNPGYRILPWILILWFASTHAAARESPRHGELETLSDKPAAPEFRLSDPKGRMHALSDFRGKVLVVNFWAVWCRPCREEMPAMQRAWEQLRDQDVVFLGINWGDYEDSIERFFTYLETDVDFLILMDQDKSVTTEWGVKGLPTTYVIDPQGRMVYRVVGERDWDEPELMQLVLDQRER